MKVIFTGVSAARGEAKQSSTGHRIAKKILKLQLSVRSLFSNSLISKNDRLLTY